MNRECEINGETIGTAELPYYPAMGTVATETDESVIIKIVNFDEREEPVDITLDCQVEKEYTVGLLTGCATEENSLEQPENVRDATLQAAGAAKAFTYTAPPLSVSVLTLRKKG